jgi:hypothetical protein
MVAMAMWVLVGVMVVMVMVVVAAIKRDDTLKMQRYRKNNSSFCRIQG